VKNKDCGERGRVQRNIHIPWNVFNNYARKMPLIIKVLKKKKACPVLKEIM